MTTFSVLICTYNRHELLQMALQALAATAEKPDEIVIVNGGDERADAIVADLRRQYDLNIELIPTINVNLATSRNIGLVHCHGEIVAMTDDDAEVFPDWVTQMKRVHCEHPEAGAVGGAIIGTASQQDFLSRLSDIVTFPRLNSAGYARTLPGVNISYKRSVLEKVGLQDETLFRGEDVDFNWRILKLGYEVFYHPDIKVYHHHRPTLRGFINQHYMYGRAYYLVRRKWPDMYCVYPHQIRQPKDVAKALNFVAAAIYEPFFYVARLPNFRDKFFAIPILIANQLGWRGGMVYQKWLTTTRRST